MEEVATLVIRVKSEDADAAKARLKQLGFASKEAETATGGLTAAWKAMAGFLAGGAGLAVAISALTKLKDTAKQFESLEAQLKTATGSAENAKKAFAAIQDFAQQTPYDLAQSTDAFIKLVNLGLNPGERALRSYGNTSSAMGKSLEEMVLAVSNATVGQFITLRQFGIKAETEADGIAFTFRGTTTKVKNDAKSIEEFFIQLGEKNFTGAMAERMVTLEGKLSNLGDAWDVLFATISKAGAGDLMKQAIDIAINAIQEFTDMIASGQLGGYVDALLGKFEVLGEGVYNAFQNITSVLEMSFQYWTTDGKGAVDFLIGAFKNLPENVRMVMRAVGAGFATLIDYAGAVGAGVYESFAGVFTYLIDTAKNVGKEIWSHLKPGAADFDYTAAQAAAYEKYAGRVNNAWDAVNDSLKESTDLLGQVITEGMNERDASIASFAAKIKGADALREAYDRLQAARKKAGEGKDRLAGFQVTGTSPSSEFREMVKALRTQEQVLAETYAKRKQLILDNTGAETSLRKELMTTLDRQYADERKQILDKSGLDLEVQKTSILDAQSIEVKMLQDGYIEKQKILDDALAAKIVSQEEYNRRSKQLTERKAMEEDKITREHIALNRSKELNAYSEVLGMAATITDQLSQIAVKGSAASKAAFVAAKGIAIAQGIVYTELAAVRALAEGGTIAGIPLSTAIRALGYASVAIMAAQAVAEYSQHEHGGMIGAGKTGITQEAGFEFVRGPAVVTSARATADQMAGQGGNQTNVQVNVINQAGAEVTTQERDTPDGKIIDVLVRRVDREIANRTRTGNSDTGKAMADVFGLRRGAA